MRKFAIIGILLVLVLAVSASLVLTDDVTVVEEVDLPQAVLQTFQNSYPEQTIKNFDTGVVGGKTRYELEIRVDNKDLELVYLEDGTLYQTEEDISVESLPELVVKSIGESYPKSNIEEAVKIIRSTITEFEVEVEVGEEDFELLVSADGKIIKSDQLKDDDDEDEDDADEDDDDDDEVDDSEDD